MAKTYEPISTQVLSSTQTVITFSSIPQTYTDLVLIINAKNTSTGNYILTRFNSDSGTNYSQTRLVGNGSTASSARDVNDNSFAVMYQSTATDPGICIMHIMNYANTTTYKTAISRDSYAADTTFLRCALWRNTNAISTITLTINGGSFNTTSSFTLYGIKAA